MYINHHTNTLCVVNPPLNPSPTHHPSPLPLFDRCADVCGVRGVRRVRRVRRGRRGRRVRGRTMGGGLGGTPSSPSPFKDISSINRIDVKSYRQYLYCHSLPTR
jgi:hypothetical protein